MSLSERSKRFEMAKATPVEARPKIWVEGRQRPKFDVKAYVAVTIGMARRDLAPTITASEERLRELGGRVASGETRLGLAPIAALARVMPSHQATGRSILGLARVFATSHAMLVPVEMADPVATLRPPLRTRATPAELRLTGKRAAPVAEGPKIDAVRSALRQALPELGGDAEVTAAASANAGPVLGGRLHRLGSRSLLGLLMALALPGGAVRAMLFHMAGGDLADWS